jgi:hypothetical protein
VIPSFTGQRVTTVSLDYMVRFFTDAGWQFDLEGDVELHPADDKPVHVDKDGPGTPMPQILESIRGQEIRDIQISARGDLDIALETVRVVTRGNRNYEAWQVYGPQGEIIVGGPGDTLTSWGPRRN